MLSPLYVRGSPNYRLHFHGPNIIRGPSYGKFNSESFRRGISILTATDRSTSPERVEEGYNVWPCRRAWHLHHQIQRCDYAASQQAQVHSPRAATNITGLDGPSTKTRSSCPTTIKATSYMGAQSLHPRTVSAHKMYGVKLLEVQPTPLAGLKISRLTCSLSPGEVQVRPSCRATLGRKSTGQ